MKPVTIKGKQSTRDIILYALKTTNHLKVEELAGVAGVSPVTVRHHLNSLQADGLIEVDRVRRKVGRPYYVYSLSEAGHEMFPRKYVRLTNRLLDEIRDSLEPDTIQNLFSGMAQKIIHEHKGLYESLPFEDRLQYLVNILAEEGFVVEWEQNQDGEGYTLTEYNCPYHSIGDEHMEVCGLDTELMVAVLQTPVEQCACILNGDSTCKFTFAPQPA